MSDYPVPRRVLEQMGAFMDDEARYTLDEARQKLNERECATHGHSWDVLGTLSGIPDRIVCGTCGRSYRVDTDSR